MRKEDGQAENLKTPCGRKRLIIKAYAMLKLHVTAAGNKAQHNFKPIFNFDIPIMIYDHEKFGQGKLMVLKSNTIRAARMPKPDYVKAIHKNPWRK